MAVEHGNLDEPAWKDAVSVIYTPGVEYIITKRNKNVKHPLIVAILVTY